MGFSILLRWDFLVFRGKTISFFLPLDLEIYFAGADRKQALLSESVHGLKLI